MVGIEKFVSKSRDLYILYVEYNLGFSSHLLALFARVIALNLRLPSFAFTLSSTLGSMW